MREALQAYVKRVGELAEHVRGNEQATEQSLVGPLFTILGYDLTDPRECIPEYRVDFGPNRSVKPTDRKPVLADATNEWARQRTLTAVLGFQEKGGKSREIPVRHDLEGIILAYVDAAGISGEAKDAPLFRASNGRSRKLAAKPLGTERICELVKRRLKDAGLPSRLSPHSFRVTAITSLLEQGVPMEDVQYLAGHAEPRTTTLYDRRTKKVTRNIVERIPI